MSATPGDVCASPRVLLSVRSLDRAGRRGKVPRHLRTNFASDIDDAEKIRCFCVPDSTRISWSSRSSVDGRGALPLPPASPTEVHSAPGRLHEAPSDAATDPNTRAPDRHGARAGTHTAQATPTVKRGSCPDPSGHSPVTRNSGTDDIGRHVATPPNGKRPVHVDIPAQARTTQNGRGFLGVKRSRVQISPARRTANASRIPREARCSACETPHHDSVEDHIDH